jgi:hypothetical protein
MFRFILRPKHLIQFIMLLQYLFDIMFVLDLQLPVSITTKVLSSNPVHGEVCDDDKIMIKLDIFFQFVTEVLDEFRYY